MTRDPAPEPEEALAIELHHPEPERDRASKAPWIRLVFEAAQAMGRHVRTDTTVEQGGVLIGRFDAASNSTVVHASIPAEGAVSKEASLTFTHETWDFVSRVMESDFPGDQMVGWYHSHPHFGIFLSDFDRFIHANFFSQPWQVAYVIDPLLEQDGFFGWQKGRVVRYLRWEVTEPLTGGSADDPSGAAAD